MYDFYHVRVCCIDSVFEGPFNSYDFFLHGVEGRGRVCRFMLCRLGVRAALWTYPRQTDKGSNRIFGTHDMGRIKMWVELRQ